MKKIKNKQSKAAAEEGPMDVDMDAAAEAAGTKPKVEEDRGARCQKATGLKEEFQEIGRAHV